MADLIDRIDRIESAIRHIQTATDVDPWAAEIAVEAMRKQIPEKPMKSLDVDNKSLYRLYCPTCGVKIGHGNSRVGYIVKTYGSEKYCGNCGQAIAWEEVRDDDHNADIGKKVEQTVETAQNVQNGDLISRKWLVECIEEGWVKFDTAKDCNRMMHLVRDIAPSVQPERKPGHWLKISPAGIYECSECGKNVMTADIDAYEFCHGCGCRMMEVEHEKKT